MKKIIIFCVIILSISTNALSVLDENELKSIGQFIQMDFESNAQYQPLTHSFFSKETGDFEFINEDEINSLKGIKVNLKPGKYKKIVIINEITNVGVLVRYAYLDNNRVFWAMSTHSLLNLQLRPELGNTGVLRLMDLTPENLINLLNGCQKGMIPRRWKPSKAELIFYKDSIDAIEIVLLNRL